MAGYKKNKRGEKKPQGWEPCKHKPWTDDMVMTPSPVTAGLPPVTGSSTTITLHWENKHDSSIFRIPQPVKCTFWGQEPLTIAGKTYDKLSELRAKKDPENREWYEDKYGREVFYLAEEKFCVLDPNDTMYDDRYIRWYFLREGHKLTRVVSDDTESFISVTEDVRQLEADCWRQMQNLNYFG